VLPGDRGAPVWPPGVVGSMTHCDGYRAAALALDSQIRTIGVDAEPNLSLPDGVLGKVAGPDERAALSGYAAVDPGVNWDRLLFCAKEAVYKAWFPLARRWLGFLDAHVVFDPREGTFVARLLVSPPLLDGRPLEGFTGRWHSGAGLLLAAIAVPPVPV